MHSIYELVTLDCQNEHDLEHDLEHKTKFSTPKIFDAKGDLSKRWYIYFSYRNPRTGKLKRMKNIYGKAHRFKTKESRYSVLNLYKRRLLKLLKEGYNPFEDNTKFHSEKLKVISQKATILQPKQNMNQTVLDSQQPKFDAVDIYQPNSQPKTVLVEGLKKKTVVDELATAKGHTIDEALDRALLLKINIVSKTTLNDYKSRINQ